MIPTLPLKAIGAGVLVLAIIGGAIWLINYGTKLGRAEAEIVRLEGELEKADDWKKETLLTLEQKDRAIDQWRLSSLEFEQRFRELQAQPPEVVTRWREIAREVPVEVPVGDCDQAAIVAWSVLNRAGIVGVPP